MIRLRDRFFDKSRFAAATIFQYYYQSSKKPEIADLLSSMTAHACLRYFGIGDVTLFSSLYDENVSRAAASIEKRLLVYLVPIMRTVKTIEDGRQFLSDARIDKISEKLSKAIDYAFLGETQHINKMVLDATKLYSSSAVGGTTSTSSPDFYLWASVGLLSKQHICGVEVTPALQRQINELAASKSDLSIVVDDEIWPRLISSLFRNEYNNIQQ